MNHIRRAASRDIPRLLELLRQVNMVHHEIRPDLFKGPATKYSAAELELILGDELTPIFVCADEADQVLGYVFCILQDTPDTPLTPAYRTLYIDDLCVDETVRGSHVGSALYRHVCAWAKAMGCYNLTLNVWTGNDSAQRFYEHMGMKPLKTYMEQLL